MEVVVVESGRDEGDLGIDSIDSTVSTDRRVVGVWRRPADVGVDKTGRSVALI